jgi:hypothetical protein
MKSFIAIPLLMSAAAFGQLKIEDTEATTIKYHISGYSYHDKFKGHNGYGAPVILTSDGGAALFGDSDEGVMLLKLDKTGKEQWKRKIAPKFDETESQSVVQDSKGNFYVFQLLYDQKRYRGGSERIVCINKAGTIVWDKTIGSFSQVNNPIVDYIRAQPDGKIYLRGHVVRQKPPEGQDPDTLYWEGWIDSTGKLSEKTGEKIDWGKEEWQRRFSPES